jgi:ABC-type uncharacterized transport system substrate-binding protein
VIVAAGTPASRAVKQATTSVPLVMVAVGDPVATGLVASLGRPGGNITGVTSISEDLERKRLELLREVLPTVSRVAVLWNPENQSLLAELKEIRAAAQVLGMTVQALEARGSEGDRPPPHAPRSYGGVPASGVMDGGAVALGASRRGGNTRSGPQRCPR